MSADPWMIKRLKESWFAPKNLFLFLNETRRESHCLLHHRIVWRNKSSKAEKGRQQGMNVQMMDKSTLCSRMILTEESKDYSNKRNAE